MFEDCCKNEAINYKFQEKKLFIKLDDGSMKEMSFNFPIRQVLEFEDKILVRLEPDIGKILNENVFCYAKNGDFLWQVQKTNTIDKDCPYTNIAIKDKKLFLYNWSGEKVLVNLNCGEILSKEFTK